MDDIIKLENYKPSSVVTKISVNKIFYYLLRFHFVFFPFNLLLSKLTGITYLKDIVYIICTFIGIKYITEKKFIRLYLIFVSATIIIQLLHETFYLEYVTWFIMGLPLCMYIKCIKAKDFDKDCYLIGCLMLLAFLWILFFESNGGYEYTFVKEKDLFTLYRGEGLRVRFAFISPMALSQYCWFTLLLIIFNCRVNNVFKTIVSCCIVYIIITCNTRAGILLSMFSIIIYTYGKFFHVKKSHVLIFTCISVIILILQVSLNAQNLLSDTQVSDEERIAQMSKGLILAKDNILLGAGGVFYSLRSGQGQVFENTWLSLIYCFGIIGLFMSLQFIYQILIVNKSFLIIIFSIPWIIYSFIFPVTQEINAVHITWFIIAMTLYSSKTKYLFYQK